jgi:hypothetical protein
MKINDLKNKIIDLINNSKASLEESYYAVFDIYSMMANQYQEAIKQEEHKEEESTEAINEQNPVLDLLGALASGTLPSMPVDEVQSGEAEIVEEKEEEKE